MKKIVFMLLSVLSILLVGCNNTLETQNQTIIENIVLNQSTYDDIKNIMPDIEKEVYWDNTLGIYTFTDFYYADYFINTVKGEFSFYFDEKTNQLTYACFYPSDYSKESGDSLKTWLFDKYKDYEQVTKDTGFIFSNNTENVELYITENPIDNTKYYGLYIEWTVKTDD